MIKLEHATYARDLAKLLLNIVESNSSSYGVYHYSNEGVASWFDFAKAIFELSKIDVDTTPIASSLFPQVASRPSYSVLDKTKVKNEFNIEIPNWKESMAIALKTYSLSLS